MSNDPLDKLIADQQREGSYQGEDGFTISVEDALRKLAQHQLPEKHDWVLKVVQAAVRLHSGEIRVSMSADRLQFDFDRPNWTPDQVVSALANPNPTDDTALNHLVVALRALLLHLKYRYRLTLADSQCLEWSGESVLPATISDPGEEGALVVWLARSERKPRLGHAKEFAEILIKFTRQACACPIPLWADGRRVDSLFYWTGSDSLWLPLASDPLEVPGLPTWKPPFNAPLQGQVESWIRTRYPTDQSVEATSSVNTALVAMLFARFTKIASRTPVPTPSVLCWIRDGVVVQTDPLTYKFDVVSLVGFCSAEDLETDLTGFRLRRTPELVERRGKVLLALREWLKLVRLPQGEEKPGGLPKTLVLLMLPGLGWAAALLLWRDRRLLHSLRATLERGLEHLREQTGSTSDGGVE